jgi:hypothetical protein
VSFVKIVCNKPENAEISGVGNAARADIDTLLCESFDNTDKFSGLVFYKN